VAYKFRDKSSVAPGDVHDNDAFAIKVVGVAHPGNFYNAYSGPSDWSDEQVAAQGDEIPQVAAKALFWVLANSGRRWGSY